MREFYELLRKIPKRKVTTYGAIARAAGRPRAARWAGKLLAANARPDHYPCYKVIRSDGSVGRYSGGGTKEKIRRLKRDGIEIKNGRVDLKKYGFYDF